MAQVTATREYETSDTVTASNYNDDRDEIIDGVNSINNSQIASDAAIVATKLNLATIAESVAITTTATTGNAFSVTRNLASGSSNAAVAQFTQDHASDDQSVVAIQNDGTGRAILITQTGDGNGLRIDSSGNKANIIVAPEEVLAAGNPSVYIISTQDQVNSNLLFVHLSGASSTVAPVQIKNEGTGNALHIDHNGDQIAINVDSESTSYPLFYGDIPVADNVASFDIRHSGSAAFRVARIDDTNEDICIIIGGYYFWVDSTGDFRIKNSAPTSDTDGAVVGSQS